MALLSIYDVTAAGITPTFAAATAGGDTFVNDGQTILYVKNASASSVTVTIAAQKTCSQGYTHPLVVTVNASSEKAIGTLNPAIYNNDQGIVSVAYSAVTSVTVAALQI